MDEREELERGREEGQREGEKEREEERKGREQAREQTRHKHQQNVYLFIRSSETVSPAATHPSQFVLAVSDAQTHDFRSPSTSHVTLENVSCLLETRNTRRIQ